MKTKIPPFDSVKQYQLNPHDRFSRYQHCSDLWPLKVKRVHPRANGTKRRSGCKPGARVLIPPQLFTHGETKALAKSKVHQ
jgi:hypothetical protein